MKKVKKANMGGKRSRKIKKLEQNYNQPKKKHIKVQKRRAKKSHKQKIMTCGL